MRNPFDKEIKNDNRFQMICLGFRFSNDYLLRYEQKNCQRVGVEGEEGGAGGSTWCSKFCQNISERDDSSKKGQYIIHNSSVLS